MGAFYLARFVPYSFAAELIEDGTESEYISLHDYYAEYLIGKKDPRSDWQINNGVTLTAVAKGSSVGIFEK